MFTTLANEQLARGTTKAQSSLLSKLLIQIQAARDVASSEIYLVPELCKAITKRLH
jgi:hypothetical protein